MVSRGRLRGEIGRRYRDSVTETQNPIPEVDDQPLITNSQDRAAFNIAQVRAWRQRPEGKSLDVQVRILPESFESAEFGGAVRKENGIMSISDSIDRIRLWLDMWADEQAEVEQPSESELAEREIIKAGQELLKTISSTMGQLAALRDNDMPTELPEAVGYMIDHSNAAWSECAKLRREIQRLREALTHVKEYAEGHHSDEESCVWLHGLTIDIPHMIEGDLKSTI